MGEFVEIQIRQPKIRDLVDESAILCAHAKITRDIEVGAAAVNESTSGLPLRSRHDELFRWIEDDCSTAAQGVRPDAPRRKRDVCNQRSSHFVEVCLKSRRTGGGDVVLRVARISIIAFSAKPSTELIRVSDEEAAGLRRLMRRRLNIRTLRKESCALNADL